MQDEEVCRRRGTEEERDAARYREIQGDTGRVRADLHARLTLPPGRVLLSTARLLLGLLPFPVHPYLPHEPQPPPLAVPLPPHPPLPLRIGSP